LGVTEGVDDSVDAGGDVVHAAAELVVDGRAPFVRRSISGSSMNPPW
jgi:hypothetical protein